MEREGYISDEMVVKRVNEAVKMELKKKKALDVPVYVYNRKTKKIYQKNSDGTQKTIERMWKGRYSIRTNFRRIDKAAVWVSYVFQ